MGRLVSEGAEEREEELVPSEVLEGVLLPEGVVAADEDGVPIVAGERCV